MLDNALELLVLGGRSLPHAMMMLIPEAWGPRYQMSEDRRAFYEYHAAFMEPWDGPAAVAFTDGRFIGGTLDRNGLRPARWTETKDGLVVLASESGVIEFAPERILRRGRLQPGRMFLVDLEEHRVVPDREIKARIARQRPYRNWVHANRIELRGLFESSEIPAEDPALLRARQHAHGYTEEECRMVLSPMAARGQEAVGSMGNDAALAVLSDAPGPALRLLQAALRAGHQPADRPAARGARDVADELHRAAEATCSTRPRSTCASSSCASPS